MTTWEARMAQRAAARRAAEPAPARTDEQRQFDEQMAAAIDVDLYEGTCDVCGGPISVRHSPTVSGIVDVGIDRDPDGGDVVYTWARHIGGPQRGCDIYSSQIYRQALQVAEGKPASTFEAFGVQP